MNLDHGKQERLVRNLRPALPVSAYPRPALLDFLRARRTAGRVSPRLRVIDIFDAGRDCGPMCRFTIAGDTDGAVFVAPLAQLALERRRAVASDASLRRRHSYRPGA